MDTRDLHTRPFSVPQDYFKNLETRLKAIPSSEAPAQEHLWMMKFKPYMKLAAIFALAIVAGSLYLRFSASSDPEETISYEQFAYAGLIPYTLDETQYYECGLTSSSVSDEDIIEFLINPQTDGYENE